MKFLAAIFILFSLTTFSQTQTIKIKKEAQKPSLVQSKSPWLVTFCNYYYGTIKLVDLFNPNNKLVISNNTIDLKIIRFDLTWRTSLGKLYNYTTTGDSITIDIRKQLLQIDKRSKLFISDIKAVSKYQDTIFLNPIELRVVD